MSHLRFALLVSALFPSASAIADSAMQGENLLQALPHGYKIGYQTRQGQMSMSEMVPSDESVESWTSMVTTQVFHGARIPADAFQQRLAANLSGACSSANAVKIDAGEEDGYTYTLWQHVCPLNPATGKPEHFWSKTIEGNDAFYSVQFAFRHAPSERDTNLALRHLAGVRLCDSRIRGRDCPNVRPVHQD
jgi:hypothetical protein